MSTITTTSRCSSCGRINDTTNYKTCSPCRSSRRNRSLQYKTAGLCTSCGAEPSFGYYRCLACRDIQKREEARLVLEVFNAYGGYRCICCGISDPGACAVDHKYGGGTKERQSSSADGSPRGGIGFYRRLKKRGFPPGYQVLCHNCNKLKGTSPACPGNHSWTVPDGNI